MDDPSLHMYRLVYWVVYSFFTIIEAFVSIILYWCVRHCS